MEHLIQTLTENRIAFLREEPLSKHTSFRIGGPAELMVFPATAQDLATVLRCAAAEGLRPIVLGAGTNVLAPDAGKRGLVLCTKDCLCGIEREGETGLRVMAGVLLARAATFARDAALTGMEFAHGIPGTMGGGLYMNAGAYGGELRQLAEETTVMAMDGTVRTLSGEAQGFGYRASAFQHMDCVIVSCVLRLSPGDPIEIQEKMQTLSARRRASQPLELPSAGSTFKRPVGGYAAALIEQAGLKGQGVGGARVSEKHAGFVVNCGGATEADVLKTVELIQKRVYETSGIVLEPEIKRL